MIIHILLILLICFNLYSMMWYDVYWISNLLTWLLATVLRLAGSSLQRVQSLDLSGVHELQCRAWFPFQESKCNAFNSACVSRPRTTPSVLSLVLLIFAALMLFHGRGMFACWQSGSFLCATGSQLQDWFFFEHLWLSLRLGVLSPTKVRI